MVSSRLADPTAPPIPRTGLSGRERTAGEGRRGREERRPGPLGPGPGDRGQAGAGWLRLGRAGTVAKGEPPRWMRRVEPSGAQEALVASPRRLEGWGRGRTAPGTGTYGARGVHFCGNGPNGWSTPVRPARSQPDVSLPAGGNAMSRPEPSNPADAPTSRVSAVGGRPCAPGRDAGRVDVSVGRKSYRWPAAALGHQRQKAPFHTR